MIIGLLLLRCIFVHLSLINDTIHTSSANTDHGLANGIENLTETKKNGDKASSLARHVTLGEVAGIVRYKS